MNKKYKKQAKVAMAVALTATSIAHSASNLFAQSEEMISENTLTDVEEVKEETTEIEGLETEVEETLESKESIQYIEKAVGDVAMDATNFPNTAFRDYIRTNFDTNNDGVLSSDEIANITRINIYGNTNITSVQGIEHFPNLTYLDCSHTGITSIDVSKNTVLEEFWCHNTGLTRLDVTKNPALINLNCGSTQITSIDVSKNTNLEHLDASNMPLTSLDVSKNTKLRHLGFWTTSVASIDLSNNLELRGLHCSGTQISRLDISNNTQLGWMFIGSNPNLQLSNVIKGNSTVDLGVVERTFNIKDKFTYIDPNRVKNISGATIDISTGIVSGYRYGTPITYAYDAGAVGNVAAMLNVTLTFKGPSSISIDSELNKIYDGTAVSEPNVTKTGSNGIVSFEWYEENGTKLQTAPTDAGNYKVKAILADDGSYAEAEVEKDFTITKADSTIAINGNLDKVYDGQAVLEPTVTTTGSTGAVTFEWYEENGTKLQTAPTDAGNYKVKAILAGDSNHNGIEAEETFTITKANSTIDINGSLDKVYDGQAVLEPTVTTTGSTGAVTFEWYMADDTKLATAPTDAGDYKVKAILAEDGNFTSAEVEETFTISKATSTIAINGDLNKEYDGQPVAEPSVTTTGSTGAVTFGWYMADGTQLQSAPVNIGSYKVKAILAGDANHIGTEVEKEFTIGKAASTITINDDLNKTYDGTAVAEPTDIVTTGSTGTVTFEWYTADGTKLSEAPINAGSYKVKAILVGDANYAGIEVEKEFTIGKAASTITINDDLNKAYDGETVSEPEVSVTGSTGAIIYEWYKKEESTTRAAIWTQLTEAPKEVGSYKVVVSVAGDENYEAVTAEKEFSILADENVEIIPGQEVTGVQTGYGTQVGLWTMFVGLSTGMMMFFRRKNRKEEV